MFNPHRFCKRPLSVGLVFLSQLFISHLAWSETFTLQYNYTGATQQWIVPAGVTSVNFDIAGARGQNSNEAGYDGGYPSAGGKGGLVSGELQVTPGDTLYINIGGISGWNGGGNGGAFDAYPSLFNAGGKGGGGSDIRIGSNEIAQRVVVGGGGGGGLTTYWCCTTPTRTISGGAGGYPSGSNAPYINNWYASSAGGTQTSGCALFQGCNGPYSRNVWGGGGGGGYYGGRALSGSSGGGGSSYFNPELTTNVSYENGANGGDGYLTLVYELNQLGPTTVNPDSFEVAEGQPLSATLVFEDPNGGINYSISDQPDNGLLSIESDAVSTTITQLIVPFNYIANQDFTGTDQFTVSLTDALSATTAITISISVLGDADNDGISDPDDPDDDNDGVEDINDAFPFDPLESADSDGDGVGDNADAFPLDPLEISDSDADGTGDNADLFPNDPSETVDSDSDGVGDNGDAFPNDPSETADSDGDGVGDNTDALPNDATETEDSDGDGIGNNADADDDNDGVIDAEDAFPYDSSESLDTDSDGLGNNADSDDDNDGVDDALDALPLDQYETVDTDGDGIGNNADPDDDNDGYLDAGNGDYFEASNITLYFYPKSTTTDLIAGEELIDGLDDFNLFGLRLSGYQEFEFRDHNTGDNYRFTSVIIEQGGISTSASLIGASEDASPVPIRFEPESAMTLQALIAAILNGDDLGTFSIQRGEQVDIDAFPLDPNEWVDSDGDGVGDNSDAFPNDPSETLDTDGDGVGDNADAFPNDPAETADSDSDGVGDNADAFPEDASETVDTDGDGIGNNADPDDDNDGYQDYATEPFYEGTADNIYFSAKDSITSLSPGVQLIWWLSDFNLFDMRYMGYQEFEFNDNDGGPSYRFTSVIVQQGVITARASAINTETDASELVIRLYPELEFTDQELLAAVLDDDELGSFSIEVAEAADLVVDVFPLDPSEWFDTDDDGIGNNADADDDGDGVADSEDAFPLDVNEIMDTDGDGIGNNADADDDGDGIPDRVDLTPLGDIFVHNLMDVDGNGHLDPLTDGMLLMRHMFGFTGQALIEDALGENATRTDPAEIEAHLETIMGGE